MRTDLLAAATTSESDFGCESWSLGGSVVFPAGSGNADGAEDCCFEWLPPKAWWIIRRAASDEVDWKYCKTLVGVTDFWNLTLQRSSGYCQKSLKTSAKKPGRVTWNVYRLPSIVGIWYDITIQRGAEKLKNPRTRRYHCQENQTKLK